MGVLAGIVRRVPMTAGTALFAASAPAALWVILSGDVSLDAAAGGDQVLAKAGDIIGSFSMLSGQPLGKTGRCCAQRHRPEARSRRAVRSLGERPELLRQLFEGMFRIGAEAAAVPARGWRNSDLPHALSAICCFTASTMCLAEIP